MCIPSENIVLSRENYIGAILPDELVVPNIRDNVALVMHVEKNNKYGYVWYRKDEDIDKLKAKLLLR